jgi:hypothetical protein
MTTGPTRYVPVALSVILVLHLIVASSSPSAFAAALPNNASTGVVDREALVFHDGDLELNPSNVAEWLNDEGRPVVENLEIRGSLYVRGVKNVLIRNVHVYTSSFWTVRVFDGASAVVTDTEIGHQDHVGQRGIGGSDIVARRLNIHHVEDGVKLGSNTEYDSIYCHDLASLSENPHYDCIQDDGGHFNYSVTNSYLDPKPDSAFHPGSTGNAALMIKSDLGPISDVLISDNYLNSGNYTIFVLDGGHGSPQQIAVTSNAFGRDYRYGILDDGGQPVADWSGNYWADTAQIIDKNGNPTGGGANPTTATTSSSMATVTTAASAATTATSISTPQQSSGSESVPSTAPSRGENPTEGGEPVESPAEADGSEDSTIDGTDDTSEDLIAGARPPNGTTGVELSPLVVLGIALVIVLVLGLALLAVRSKSSD